MKCVVVIFRQDDRDGEDESPKRDGSDKFMHKLAKDSTLTSWHTGFHVSLVCSYSNTKCVYMR
jgi:hypothetical protein